MVMGIIYIKMIRESKSWCGEIRYYIRKYILNDL